MENIESASSRFDEACTQQKGSHSPPYRGFGPRYGDSDFSADMLSRRGDAWFFQNDLNLLEKIIEQKEFISADHYPFTVYWREYMCGIPRIGVHGMDSICVVARKEDVVNLRRQVRQADYLAHRMRNEECWIEYFHDKFMNAVIFEVEELAVECPESYAKIHGRVNLPFGVVSFKPSTDTVDHKASGPKRRRFTLSDECDVENAIEFLQAEMKSDTAFAFIKTVKTAISALQHLFRKEFKANEIQVFSLRRSDGTAKVLWKIHGELEEAPRAWREAKEHEMYRDAREMPMRAERSIKDYLTLINNTEHIWQIGLIMLAPSLVP